MGLAEQKVAEAQAKALEVHESQGTSSATGTIDDLEALETPESLLLSTVSGEQSKDRTDRTIVTPWLKFLWETYRTVLDLLRNNARLELLYQQTALQAFDFCTKYARKTELRRLCELLRNHLQNAAKYSGQIHSINLSETDTLQRHLDVRFKQLNVAVDLELWQEAFRSIEDIHGLHGMSKRAPKAVMMANYYEQLTRIFKTSDNYLFHAAAWSKHFNLLRTSASALAAGQTKQKDNPSATEADLTNAANFVLLSALAIPVISTSRIGGAAVGEDSRKSKNTRLTSLLNLTAAPTRTSLFKDALGKGVLRDAKPEIRELYNILEVDFHPLSICGKISPILSKLGSDEKMKGYVQPLQQVILTRLFQQLSQVYESVELKFALELAQFPAPFEIPADAVEKFILNGCKKGDLTIRIDHAAGLLTFESNPFASDRTSTAAGSTEDEIAGSVQTLQNTPADIISGQLAKLTKALFIVAEYVDPSFAKMRAQNKAAALERARLGAEKEHVDTLARREIIDKRKAAASSALAMKEKEEATQRKIKAQQAQQAEIVRLENEKKKRENDRLLVEKRKVQLEEARRELESFKLRGLDVGDVDLENMDSMTLRTMKLAQLEKEKVELNERLRVIGKRQDHTERAYRREEIKLLAKDYEEQRKMDLENHETNKAETLEKARARHEYELSLKVRLGRLLTPFDKLSQSIRGQRREQFEAQRKAADRQLKADIDKRKKEHRETKERERKEKAEAERRAAEEAERKEREEAEKAAKEAEMREKMAAEKEKRDADRRETAEVAKRQMAREEEVAARRAKEKTSAVRRPLLDVRSDSVERPSTAGSSATESRAPRFVAGGGGGWREKMAAKEAAAAAGGSPELGPSARTGRLDAAAPRQSSVRPREEMIKRSEPRDSSVAASSSAGDEAGLRATGTGYVPPHLRKK